MNLNPSSTFFVTYHYVNEMGRKNNLHALSTTEFKATLENIADRFPILGKEDYLNFCDGNSTPGAFLTFDDALSDHFSYVMPILDELDLFGIFFLNSESLKQEKLLNVHAAHALLSEINAETLYCELNQLTDLTLVLKKSQEDIYINESNGPVSIFKRWINYSSWSEEKEFILNLMIDKYLNTSMQQLAEKWYLSSSEATEIAQAGHLIGNHGLSHLNYRIMNLHDAITDIEKSRFSLEQDLGIKLVDFAFPFGGISSFTEELIFRLTDLNYRNIFTTIEEIVNEARHRELMWLPRFDCNRFI